MAQRASTVPDGRDDLDDYVAELTAISPGFPRLLREASQREQLTFALSEARKEAGLSQKTLAERMRVSVAVVARLEQGGLVAALATVQRYASAVGKPLDWQLVEGEQE